MVPLANISGWLPWLRGTSGAVNFYYSCGAKTHAEVTANNITQLEKV